jgi:muconolactone delta-isomerase
MAEPRQELAVTVPQDPTAQAVERIQARTGLSERDLEAFVAAWERAGRPGTLEEFLGFVPEQRTHSEQRLA